MMTYRLARTFGGIGTKPGEFAGPLTGLALDAAGRLLASAGPDVQVFDAAGAPLARWPASGEALCVAAAKSRTVLVGHRGSVSLHDPAGKLIATWTDSERLGAVTSIAPAAAFVYLADSHARLVRRFTAQGIWTNDIGGDNPTRGFHIPNGVLSCALDAAGILHVANSGKHRVERYSPEGSLLAKVGRFDQLDPAGFPGCCNPCTLAVDAKGNLLVAEKAPPRVKLLSPEGRLLAVIATSILDPMARNCPIAVDAKGRVFIADPVRSLIHRFEAAL